MVNSLESLEWYEFFDWEHFAYDDVFHARINEQRRSVENELFFDKLCQWIGLDHVIDYPPKNVEIFKHSLMEIDQVSCDQLKKCCLIYYLLRDWHQGRHKDFAKEYYLPKHFQCLIDGYWLLDHGHYEEALKHIMHPTVDIHWKNKIMRTLYNHGKLKEAILFMRGALPEAETEEDIQLHLNVLLKNRLLFDAFLFQRKYPMTGHQHWFYSILDECFLNPHPNANDLHTLLGLPYQLNEELALIQYCSEKQKQQLSEGRYGLVRDFLILFFIHHGRYIEAIQVYEQTREIYGRKGKQMTSIALEKIIENVKIMLPKVQSDLVGLITKKEEEKSKVRVERASVEPLSTSQYLRPGLAAREAQRALIEAMVELSVSEVNVVPFSQPLTSLVRLREQKVGQEPVKMIIPVKIEPKRPAISHLIGVGLKDRMGKDHAVFSPSKMVQQTTLDSPNKTRLHITEIPVKTSLKKANLKPTSTLKLHPLQDISQEEITPQLFKGSQHEHDIKTDEAETETSAKRRSPPRISMARQKKIATDSSLPTLSESISLERRKFEKISGSYDESLIHSSSQKDHLNNPSREIVKEKGISMTISPSRHVPVPKPIFTPAPSSVIKRGRRPPNILKEPSSSTISSLEMVEESPKLSPTRRFLRSQSREMETLSTDVLTSSPLSETSRPDLSKSSGRSGRKTRTLDSSRITRMTTRSMHPTSTE